jgi:phenylpyruvate tautomerase PptA (4-oxalocrotonate tautomerase family)
MTGAAGRLTLVNKTQIVRSTTAIHDEKTGAPRYRIQLIFYAVAQDSHYLIGQPAPANQIWILLGQED